MEVPTRLCRGLRRRWRGTAQSAHIGAGKSVEASVPIDAIPRGPARSAHQNYLSPHGKTLRHGDPQATSEEPADRTARDRARLAIDASGRSLLSLLPSLPLFLEPRRSRCPWLLWWRVPAAQASDVRASAADRRDRRSRRSRRTRRKRSATRADETGPAGYLDRGGGHIGRDASLGHRLGHGSADGPQVGGSMDTTTGGDGDHRQRCQRHPAGARRGRARATKPAPSPTKPMPAPTKPAPAEAALARRSPRLTHGARRTGVDEPAPTSRKLAAAAVWRGAALRRCSSAAGGDGAAQTTMGKTHGVDSLVGTKLSRAMIIKVLGTAGGGRRCVRSARSSRSRR